VRRNTRPTGRNMKRCAVCHGKLGLGARSRNIWNGTWWVHIRFCSSRCEAIYQEDKQNDGGQRPLARLPCWRRSAELSVCPKIPQATNRDSYRCAPSDPRAIGKTPTSLLVQRLPTADSMPRWLSKCRLRPSRDRNYCKTIYDGFHSCSRMPTTLAPPAGHCIRCTPFQARAIVRPRDPHDHL
jgi:hypothetical protein